MVWYRALVYLAHTAIGRKSPDVSFYIWAENIVDALKKFNTSRGIKKSRIPSIRELSKEEAKTLEARIIRNCSLTIAEVRQRGVYPLLTRAYHASYFRR